MATFEILLGLVALCVGLAVLAQRLGIPVAVPLVLGGMGVALIPGLPAIDLDPELALALFLPPLLQISAYRTDWPAFKNHLRPILLLAIGAVFFTAAAVAVVAHLIVPSCHGGPRSRSAPSSRRRTWWRPSPSPVGSDCRGDFWWCWKAKASPTTPPR